MQGQYPQVQKIPPPPPTNPYLQNNGHYPQPQYNSQQQQQQPNYNYPQNQQQFPPPPPPPQSSQGLPPPPPPQGPATSLNRFQPPPQINSYPAPPPSQPQQQYYQQPPPPPTAGPPIIQNKLENHQIGNHNHVAPPTTPLSQPRLPMNQVNNHHIPDGNLNYSNNNNYQHQPQQDQKYIYPQSQLQSAYQNQQNQINSLSNQIGGLSVTNQGFNKLWGNDCVDLLKTKNILPIDGVKPPEIKFQHEYMNSLNCSPDLFRCTLTKIPETKTLLQKCRLPLGILIHPFKDLTQLPVIQCSTIVRCRTCRTYINPFVYFIDQRRWKCNLCFRVNDLPEEFQYDPITKSYGDPGRRPEVRSATIEFLAPADYMVRPPQAAVYLFLLDVSAGAVETGYLKTVCDGLIEHLDTMPGDSRSQIGFITYDSSVHFYNLAENLFQPHQMVVCDIDDIFIPCPENLLVNIHEHKTIIKQLLNQLPTRFLNSCDAHSALGAALQSAHKLLAPIGGRITIFQCTIPLIGPGSLISRENQAKQAKDLTQVLNPNTDFYKKMALECSTQYIAVDIFFLNRAYVDIASISCVAKYSGGCIHHFSKYHSIDNPEQSFLFEQALGRYLSRKIGFEAVMRVRCSRGMSIHTFHGNLFVRSTDLLSLPNCNPDASFGMQVSIDESLSDFQHVCFQAALLYTSSKGERRIRVHTLCLPVAANVSDIINSADQQCIIGLLAKMAVDRSLSSSLMDAREAFINAVVDVLSAYASTQNSPQLSFLAPKVLTMLPVYTHAILRSEGFRNDMKVHLDERAHFMNQMKTLPLYLLIQSIYPDLYPIHTVESTELIPDIEEEIPDFPRLQLCSDRIDANGVYLMDSPDIILVYVCRSVSSQFCQDVFGVSGYHYLNELHEFPELETTSSNRIRNFVSALQGTKPYCAAIKIVRDDSKQRMLFVNRLVEDRSDYSVSYYEFLQQLKNMIK